jgi:hypothetical protein
MLALMTGPAQACCAKHCSPLEAKILAKPSHLGNHAALSPQFRAPLGNVRRRWQVMHGACVGADTADGPRLWHASQASFQ